MQQLSGSSKQLSFPATEKKLLTLHNLTKIKRKKKTSVIFTLQSSLVTKHFKDKNPKISCRCKATSSTSTSDLQSSINSLKIDNTLLHQRIDNLKFPQIKLHKRRINQLKKAHHNHGHQLKEILFHTGQWTTSTLSAPLLVTNQPAFL